MTLTPHDSTVAANAAFGSHPGHRALHAKGTLLKGSFTATPQAAQLTQAAHLQGEPIPVTARVSNGGGNPRVPDYGPDVRGLAVKFYLPDGSRTDIVAQTVPRLPMRTPEAFLELLHVQGSGAQMAWKFPMYLARHPGTIPRLPGNLAALRPVSSYAACRYYAIHAFRFLDAEGGSRYIRYTFVPEREEPRLWPWQARGLGRDYLQEEIRERLAAGPVRFALELQIAAPGDPVDDASATWPADRERVVAGTLELTGLDTERETGDDVLVFDPGRMTDGIELSDDPMLRYRPAAYGDSVAARTNSRG
jgi:catalase